MTDELLEKAAALQKRRVAIKDALKKLEKNPKQKSSTLYDAEMAISSIKSLGNYDEFSVDFASQLCEFIEVNLQTRLEEVQEEYANL